MRGRQDALRRLESPRFWKNAAWALLLASLVPLLILAFYDHSCADDYAYGYLTHAAWRQTGSLGAVLSAACRQVKETYLTWQGTWAATFLFALHPGIFSESAYWASAFLLLGALLGATAFFFRALLDPLPQGREMAGLFSAVVLLLQVHLLPSPVEGFYWWNGASFYVFFYALLLVQCGLFLTLLRRGRFGGARLALSCLLGLLCGGGNYVTALLAAEMTALFLLLALIFKRGRGTMGLVAALTLLSFLVNAAAPGNAVRQAALTASSPLRAILDSYRQALSYTGAWAVPLVLAALLFLLPFVWRLCRRALPGGLRLPHALGLLALLFSAFASSFTPTQYAMGAVGGGRVQNIRFFLWTLLCILAEGVLVAAVQRAMAGPAGARLRRGAAWCRERLGALLLCCVLALALCAAAYPLAGNWNGLSGLSAAASLLSGSAREYDQTADERLELLLSEEADPQLPPFSRKPYLLFFDDIQPDPSDWRNLCVASYYGKNSVRLLPEG